MGIIQDLRDEKELVLFHDYRNGAAVDNSTNEHDMTENDGTLTDTVFDGLGLTFPEATSVVTVADDDDLQLTCGCLVAYFRRGLLDQTTSEYLVSKRDGGGTNYQWLITATGCSFLRATISAQSNCTRKGWQRVRSRTRWPASDS